MGTKSAYQQAVKTNRDISDLAKKEIVQIEDNNDPIFGKEGCQKLSLHMLEEMGIVGVSKMEMNFLIYLACIQDSDGIAVTNVHMMCAEINCSISSFTELLYKLAEKKLISYRRSVDWKKNKNGIYYIDLLYNHFDKDFFNNPYIRLNHGVFRTSKFYSLTPPAKYIVLKGMESISDTPKNDVKSWVTAPFFLELLPLKAETMAWNGCAPRTFAYAVTSVLDKFNGHIETWGKKGVKRFSKGIMLNFTEEELAFRSSDNFSRMSSIIAAAGEEEGIHLCREIQDPKQLAEILYRNKKQAESCVETAKNNYKAGLSIVRDNETLKRDDWEKINQLTEELHDIMKTTHGYSEKFAFLTPKELTSWGHRKFKGTLIKDEKIPLWLRYLMGKTITVYKMIKNSISIRKWDMKEFNLMALIEEFLHAQMKKKEMNANYITRKLIEYKLSATI